MKQIFLVGFDSNEFLNEISQLIDNKFSQIVNKPLTQNEPKFISRKEVAELLKITLPTLNVWTKSGILTSYRVGKRILYKSEEVEQSIIKRDFLNRRSNNVA